MSIPGRSDVLRVQVGGELLPALVLTAAANGLAELPGSISSDHVIKEPGN